MTSPEFVRTRHEPSVADHQLGCLAVRTAIADAIEVERVVKIAPSFSEIMVDTSRTNQIVSINAPESTYGRPLGEAEPATVWTEHEALRDLDAFLTLVELYGFKVEGGQRFGVSMSDRAADMRDSLTYIGQRELVEAQAGIAEYWKSYLREDEDNELRILTAISEGSEITKSDQYMLDGVLANFSDEEIAELGDRMELFLRSTDKQPDATKVVLLDDWMISGRQMRDAVQSLGYISNFPMFVDSLEVNLATSSRQRIEDGFRYYRHEKPHSLPVKAYFESVTSSLPSVDTEDPQSIYTTGSHSSVDFSFEADHIEHMLHTLDDLKVDHPYEYMPGTTNIHRPYKVPGYRTTHIDRFHRVREEQR